jgi:cephalosporin hydroxylase
MGKLYQQVGQHLSGTFNGEVIVEIGSDRFEGSSYYFADLANQYGMKFVTVDLDAGAVGRARREIPAEWLSNCEFVCAEAVEWTRNTTLKNIKVLYLDNFDWDWSTNRHSEMIEQQRQWYSSRGIAMSNLDSQTSHITQMVNLLPHMSDQCVICVDDTYEYNGVFIGKGGAVVPYLLGQGFGLLQTGDYGVILGRGYRNYIV